MVGLLLSLVMKGLGVAFGVETILRAGDVIAAGEKVVGHAIRNTLIGDMQKLCV